MNIKKSVATAAIGTFLLFGLSSCSAPSPENPLSLEPLQPAPVSTPATTTPAPEPSPTFTYPSATEAEMNGAPEITVTRGGYFNMLEPEGWLALMATGNYQYEDIAYASKYDPDVVQPVRFNANESVDGLDIVSPADPKDQGLSLWKVADEAPVGPANILLSYIDPASGDPKTSTLIVNIK